MKAIWILTFASLLLQCKSATNNSSVASLENTYWKLAEMNGLPVITPANGKEVHFVMSNDGGEKRIHGFAGCNNLAGSYTTQGSNIKFTAITTKMMCADRMDVEDFFTKALSEANAFKIKGETLELYQGDTMLAKFESVYLK